MTFWSTGNSPEMTYNNFMGLVDFSKYSVNANVRHGNIWSSRISAGIDLSGFRNSYTDGALLSGHLGRSFRGGHLFDLAYGYSLYRVKATQQDRTTQWVRLTGRGELSRRVYLATDLEYDMGDDLKGPRALTELGYRF